eukprot:CAMPEP_0173468540 /NCGR_PEP_ID=MMETSP1357-20121228/76902_1 /TAXON_ID=77926 /ORGANISM="Hemiselmis rufescens, Strain PCC563" /LENGTH=377 /DNA_ID=CAMNT_0014436761 /DNA_START=81 /DNA_END=1211 /DNA_ORIENTATION=+
MAMYEDCVSNASTNPAGEQSELHLPEGLVRGENGRAAFATTSSACLDLFFQAVPDIDGERFKELLAAAWREEEETALRLVFNLGNCRKGEGGKSDRLNFHRGLLWVFQREPEVILANLREIARHGSHKSLLSLLQYAIHDTNTLNPSLTLEGEAAAAAAHKAHRKEIREDGVRRARRIAKAKTQARMREEYAATVCGVPLKEVWTAGKVRYVLVEAFATTSSACLDLFFHAVPDITGGRFDELLAAAWREERDTALRLVFNLGNCRKGEGGKSDRLNFHRGLLWVFQREPEVILANLREIARHGSHKSLLSLLQYAIHDTNTLNPSLTLEGEAAAAAAHKAHRKEIREDGVRRARRIAKAKTQARMREEYAATVCGV